MVCERSSVAIKNGNKDGKTEEYHSAIPFLAALKLLLENINKNIVKRDNSRFNFKNNKFKTFHIQAPCYKIY